MRFSSFLKVVGAACCVLLALAIGGAHGAQSTVDMQVTDAWIRWLPANLPNAGYMTLTNRGSQTQVLVGASSTDYGAISMHHTQMTEGMTAMMPLDAVKVAPKMAVHFAQGGDHLMLMQPRRALHPGDRVPITLRFADGQSMTVSFDILT